MWGGRELIPSISTLTVEAVSFDSLGTHTIFSVLRLGNKMIVSGGQLIVCSNIHPKLLYFLYLHVNPKGSFLQNTFLSFSFALGISLNRLIFEERNQEEL